MSQRPEPQDAFGQSASPAKPVRKQSRTRSPSFTTADASSSRQHPPKRARKAINCEPCRTSKLKCDRNRPCSSCVLRGTTASCYQGADVESPAQRAEDLSIDPAAELSRIRQSLNLLEAHIYQNAPNLPASAAGRTVSIAGPSTSRSLSTRHGPPVAALSGGVGTLEGEERVKTKAESPADPVSAPGMLGQQASDGGLYAGPTNPASLITTSDREDSDPQSPTLSPRGGHRSPNTEFTHGFSANNVAYDSDLVALLPPVQTMDGLIDYYFDYCNWTYRHVDEPTFRTAWQRFKAGQSGDRIVLATVAGIIALSVRYLPLDHVLFQSLPGTIQDIGEKHYNILLTALQRHRDNAKGLTRTYTIELIELLLLRTHYLAFAQDDPEEPWSVRGEIMSIATAIGLHRDPGKLRFTHAEAERRRWAWWHIMIVDKWQAFMFGRPPLIAAHHFNTGMPDGSPYSPFYVAFYRLAAIAGRIMDDAVSFRPIGYASVQEQDRLLAQWLEQLPPELDLDDYALVRALTSAQMSQRRLAVQSIVARSAYLHFRFTVHRPYAQVPASLELAVASAAQLISLLNIFLCNGAVAIYGHFTWQPFHAFSAAMFFSFQLVTDPDQPAAYMFKEHIRKAIDALQHCRWLAVADKALTILEALMPLYSDELLSYAPEERKRKKAQVLRVVRTLAFPYQNAPSDGLGSAYSPATQQQSRSTSSGGPSPQAGSPPLLEQHNHTQMPVSSVRWTPQTGLPPPPEVQYHPHQDVRGMIQQQPPPPPQPVPTTYNMSHMAYVQPHLGTPPLPTHPSSHHMSGHATAYMQTSDEAMWGASIGFGMGEWTQFVDALHRPDGRPRMEG